MAATNTPGLSSRITQKLTSTKLVSFMKNTPIMMILSPTSLMASICWTFLKVKND